MSINLAFKYFFKQGRKTVVLLSIVVMAVAMVFSMKTIRISGFDSQIKEYESMNGSYDIILTDVSKKTIDTTEKISGIKAMFSVEEFCYGIDSKSGVKLNISSFNQKYIEGLKYRFHGKQPIRDGEIVVEKEAINQLNNNLSRKNDNEIIGKKIDLILISRYEENGKNKIDSKKKTFKIVGLIEKDKKYYKSIRRSYTSGMGGIEPKAYISPKSDIPVKSSDKYDSIIYVGSSYKDVLSKIIKENKVSIYQASENAERQYIKNLSEHPSVKSDDIRNTLLLIIVSSLVIYNIFNIILMDMITDIGILRSIGMKIKGIKILLFTYSALYILIGSIIGIIVGSAISFLSLKIIYDYNSLLVIKLENIRYSFISSIVPIFISSIVLYRKIFKLSIVESIEIEEKYKVKNMDSKIRNSKISIKLLVINICRNKGRTLITILAMTLVSTMFILSFGKQDMYKKSANLGILSGSFGMSYGEVDRKVYGSERGTNELFYHIDDELLNEIRGIKEIKGIDECYNLKNAYLLSTKDRLSMKYIEELERRGYKSNNEFPLYIRGYNDKMLREREKFIEEGKSITDSENKTSSHIVSAIFVNNTYSKVEHSFDTKVIDDVKIGDKIKIKLPYKTQNSIFYREVEVVIEGIMNQEYAAGQDGNKGSIGGCQVILREADYKLLTGQTDYNTMFIKLNDIDNLKKVDRKILTIIEKNYFTTVGGKGEEDMFLSIEQNFYNNISIIFQVIILMVLLLQGMFVMKSNVIIRKFEIKILKNLGMSIKSLMKILFLESESYSLISAIISSVIACIIHNIEIAKINNILKQAGYSKYISYEIPFLYIAIIFMVYIIIGYTSIIGLRKKINSLKL